MASSTTSSAIRSKTAATVNAAAMPWVSTWCAWATGPAWASGCRAAALAGRAEHRDQDGQAQRPADLLRDVDHAGRGARVLRRAPRPARSWSAARTRRPCPRRAAASGRARRTGRSRPGDSWPSQAMPATTGSRPATISGLGPNRGISTGASRDTANSAPGHRAGTTARPGAGSSPSTSWTNWVRKKNIPNMPATSSSRTTIGGGAAAVGEQPQRRDRLRGPGLDQHEGREQHHGGGERGQRDPVAPAARRGA